MWHAFEHDDVGWIWDLRVKGLLLVTASGSDLIFVRLWDSVSGAMVQEYLVRVSRVPDLVSVQGGKVLLIYFDGREMEIVTRAFDSKKIGDAVKRVVKTPFQTGNIGGGKCGVSEDLELVCADSTGLHTIDMDEQADWETKNLIGVKVGTLTV